MCIACAKSQWCAPAESDLFRLVLGAIVRHADMSLAPPAPAFNAVQDALWERGIHEANMPFTPLKVWELLQSEPVAAE